MDTSKLPRLSFSVVVFAIALGLVAAAIVYQAQIKGLFSGKFSKSDFVKSQTQELRTVLKEENTIIDVVDNTSASVVAIGVSRRIVNPFDPYSIPSRQDSTIGTGFVVSEKGIVVTNRHVVSEIGAKYSVVTKDGQKYDVQKIYRDPVFDLGIIQISTDHSGLKPLEMGDSSKLKVGQTAIAIGNALGKFTNTVTTGVISGLGRKVVAGDPFSGSAESLDNLIQTDAAINPGNSGGPLLNSIGQVVGVNVATTEGAQNIGFAIPINSVKQIVDQFITNGSVSRPFLGIRYKFITKDLAVLNDIPQGAYIQDLVDGGSAQKADVRVQDIIMKVNGQTINTENKISEIVQNSKVGDSVKLTIWRDGKEIEIAVLLLEQSSE